jgi:hypothetical protein
MVHYSENLVLPVMRAVIKISKRVFFKKSQKSTILTKNEQKSIFFLKKDIHIRSLVFF